MLINDDDKSIQNVTIEHKIILNLLRLSEDKINWYGAFRVDLKFNASNYTNLSFKMKLFLENTELNVTVLKRSDKKAQNKVKIALCSKIYNFSDVNYQSFHTWIKMNKLAGFDKLIFYNNSIQLSDKHVFELKNDFKNFIEIKPYFAIPNLLSSFHNCNNSLNASDMLFYMNLKYLSMNELFLNERLAINECYLNNRYLYDYIAVLDFDEIIVPRQNEWKSESKCKLNKKNDSDFNIKNFIMKLNENYSKIVKKQHVFTSYWFRYATYIDNDLMIRFLRNFSETNIRSMNNAGLTLPFYYSHDINSNKSIAFHVDYNIPDVMHFNFLINSTCNIIYRLKNSSNLFNRVFLLEENRKYEFDYGKSIHKTNLPISIGHHEVSNPYTSFDIPYSYGFVSHFRSKLKRLNGKFNIKKLNIDYDYYFNYLSRIYSNL